MREVGQAPLGRRHCRVRPERDDKILRRVPWVFSRHEHPHAVQLDRSRLQIAKQAACTSPRKRTSPEPILCDRDRKRGKWHDVVRLPLAGARACALVGGRFALPDALRFSRVHVEDVYEGLIALG